MTGFVTDANQKLCVRKFHDVRANAHGFQNTQPKDFVRIHIHFNIKNWKENPTFLQKTSFSIDRMLVTGSKLTGSSTLPQTPDRQYVHTIHARTYTRTIPITSSTEALGDPKCHQDTTLLQPERGVEPRDQPKYVP